MKVTTINTNNWQLIRYLYRNRDYQEPKGHLWIVNEIKIFLILTQYTLETVTFSLYIASVQRTIVGSVLHIPLCHGSSFSLEWRPGSFINISGQNPALLHNDTRYFKGNNDNLSKET